MSINRFDNNDDFDFEDETFEDYLVNPDEMIIPADITRFRQEELAVVSQKVNATILKQASDIAKSSWFWHLRSSSAKLRILTQIYFALTDLVRDE